MGKPSSSHSKLTMKLLVDTKNNKVLFAEASKSVVDFLLNILYLPLATVSKLVEKNGMLPGIGNVYRSLQNLSDNNNKMDMQVTVGNKTFCV
ncbi:unnamed protein product [Lathyrus sativus]|nr:unnamed protein product [Lathyrus sativus]